MIKQGDLILTLSWSKVKRVHDDELSLVDVDSGMDFQMLGKSLIDACQSADSSDSTVKATKTKLAEVLVSSFNRPITVCFTKADGSERILRGRLVKPEPLLGRSSVEDLELPKGKRLRLVDHRSIKWITVGGVKHTLKKR